MSEIWPDPYREEPQVLCGADTDTLKSVVAMVVSTFIWGAVIGFIIGHWVW